MFLLLALSPLLTEGNLLHHTCCASEKLASFVTLDQRSQKLKAQQLSWLPRPGDCQPPDQPLPCDCSGAHEVRAGWRSLPVLPLSSSSEGCNAAAQEVNEQTKKKNKKQKASMQGLPPLQQDGLWRMLSKRKGAAVNKVLCRGRWACGAAQLTHSTPRALSRSPGEAPAKASVPFPPTPPGPSKAQTGTGPPLLESVSPCSLGWRRLEHRLRGPALPTVPPLGDSKKKAESFSFVSHSALTTSPTSRKVPAWGKLTARLPPPGRPVAALLGLPRDRAPLHLAQGCQLQTQEEKKA